MSSVQRFYLYLVGWKRGGKKSHEDFREEKEILSLVVRKFTNKEILNS